MANIENRHIIDRTKLSGEFYFNSLLQEAYTRGLLDESELEDIQLQCISLLACKIERHNMGESSSIRVETAESIMASILYSIGLYLKSLSDPDHAAAELESVKIPELYDRGIKIMNNKLHEAKSIYKMVQGNKLETLNYSYNSTISENGIGIFFKSYDMEYEAHNSPASIDYQLCNPVDDLVGIEFIQLYLEKLYLENEFCMYFATENIYNLLYGYDKGYADLLINIFEQVLTAALGCSLVNRKISELHITGDDTRLLYERLRNNNHSLMLSIHEAMNDIFEELNIANQSLRRYIESSLPKIACSIDNALKSNTLDKVFITPVNPNLESIIQFESGVKMDDEEYRQLIDELLRCRYSSDKLVLIREKVRSFDDLDDILLDAKLAEEEVISLFHTLGDIEIAAIIKRHPLESDIQTEDVTEEEQVVRMSLENFVRQLSSDRQEQILQIAEHLTF